MKTRAVRLHGANDLRLSEFELPEMKDDEILVKVISDSICMSTYKCAILGTKHKRVHEDVAEHPAIMGHEFAGVIEKVGKKYEGQFAPGMKFTLQPALNYKGTMWSPGYSYPFFGGDCTYCIIPPEVMELGCLLEYKGDAFFEASLAEPMSCSIGAFHAAFHTRMGVYTHDMGIREGGKMAILAGAGPMGFGMIDYCLHGDRQPGMLVVTDIDESRLARARQLFTEEDAKKQGVDLRFINTRDIPDAAEYLRNIAGGGYDDVFCYAPVQSVVELSSDILGRDGCLSFFAGPTDPKFSGRLNYYDVHYNSTHVIGTTGGNTDDMIESLRLTAEGRIHPAVMVTHVGGLDSAAETTLNLPKIPGGKKLIYTHISMPLTAIADFEEKGRQDERFAALHEIVSRHNGLWCLEAENYLLAHFDSIEG
ncbi:MAG: zinc-binding dehydrogenase [Clostridia bacterium]|nr:zinc-binding dehydrogenase [Clostridia bacterium]